MGRTAAARLRAEKLIVVIEADLEARAHHEQALRSAGYAVVAFASCPEPSEVALAAVVLSDVASFHWQRESSSGPQPPTIVMTDDEKAGVIACLCGASTWVRSSGGEAGLLEEVETVLRSDDGFSTQE
jgi:hypothetical protein